MLFLIPFFIPYAKPLGCNLRDIRVDEHTPDVQVSCTPNSLSFVVMNCLGGKIIGTNPITRDSYEFENKVDFSQECHGKHFTLSSQHKA